MKNIFIAIIAIFTAFNIQAQRNAGVPIKQLLLLLPKETVSQGTAQNKSTKASMNQSSQDCIVSYYWSGLINKKIPVEISLEKKGRIIQGQIVYTKTENKTPIRLIGTSYENVFQFREITNDASITGFIKGEITADGGFKGTWTAPPRNIQKDDEDSYDFVYGKEYSINLKSCKKRTSKLFSWAINVEGAVGEYSYTYGENLTSGTLQLFKRDGRLFCTVGSVTYAPSYNIAEIIEQECTWKDGRLVCIVDEDEDFSCGFEIFPFSEFAIIFYLEGYDICGFGHNATIEGIFIKQK